MPLEKRPHPLLVAGETEKVLVPRPLEHPQFLRLPRRREQALRVFRPGARVAIAADDEHGAGELADVIDRPNLVDRQRQVVVATWKLNRREAANGARSDRDIRTVARTEETGPYEPKRARRAPVPARDATRRASREDRGGGLRGRSAPKGPGRGAIPRRRARNPPGCALSAPRNHWSRR